MTFEEWALAYYGCDPAYFTGSADAKAAWEAGWAEGLAEGYDKGYDDTGICPECLNEVKHKMDCGRVR